MGRKIGLCVVLAALAATLAPFLAVEIPIGSDMPKNLLVSRVYSAFHDPELQYDRYFNLVSGLQPTSAGTAVLTFLMGFMGPFEAVRAALVLFVISVWASGAALLAARRVDSPFIHAVAFLPICHTQLVYYGFFAYFLSFPVYLTLLASYFGVKMRRIRLPVMTGLLACSYLLHVVAFAVSVFSIVLLTVVSLHKKETDAKGAILDCLAIVPASLLSLVSFWAAPARPSMDPHWNSALYTVRAYIGFNATSLSEQATWFLLGALVALVVAGAILMTRRRVDLALGGLSASLVLIGLIVPIQLGDWWLAGPRTFVFALIAGIASLGLSAVGRNVMAVGALVTVVGTGTFNVIVAQRLQERFDVYLSGAEYIRPGSYVLPILRDPGINRRAFGGEPVQGLRDVGEPFWGITDFYAILRGGAEPYVFAIPVVGTGATSIEFKSDFTQKYAYAHQMEDPRSFEERYRGVGEAYDYVVHFTDTPELDRVLESEMDVVFRNGALKIYAQRKR